LTTAFAGAKWPKSSCNGNDRENPKVKRTLVDDQKKSFTDDYSDLNPV